MTEEFRTLGPLPDVVTWRGASVLARDGRGRALMQLRDGFARIASPGKWGFFGGAVEPGETLEAAARREFSEETGVDIDGDAVRPHVRFASQALSGGLVHVFVLERRLEPAEVRLNEGAGFAFLTRAQVEQFDLIENFRRTLLQLDDF
ncbi:NUDIX domain-containing protein [Marimonas lutisalis]|uniref:NUDIX domain-containing protein n=1 Tax=Marimonas lutisalis TaxID=2545756 RepID=UPI0010F8BC03|nr:NUDIX domain-containing protein [Marimonas lutisalis]